METASPISSSSVTQANSMESTHSSIHSSMLITEHRLNGRNYMEWSQSVKLAIDERGKLAYLTGEIKQMKESDDGYNTWRSENFLVSAWLLNSMDASIAKLHMFMKTAKEVWDSVWETYSDLENSSQIFELKTKLWQSKQGSRDVTSYYNEMVSLWQELDQCHDDVWENVNDCTRQKKREENDRVYMFLAGVNRDLDEVKGRVLGRWPLPSIREVFSKVRIEENRRKIMHSNGESGDTEKDTSALFVKGNGGEENRKKPWCDYCKKLWHTRETCWKIHGKPPGGKKKPERAFHTSTTETPQEQQVNSGQLLFTKDQIEQLLKMLQATHKSPSHDKASCSFAQDGEIVPMSSYLCSKTNNKDHWFRCLRSHDRKFESISLL